MTSYEIARTIADKFIRQENVNPVYNNPGAIMDLAYYQQTGQFRLATYPDYSTGYSAMVDLIRRKGVESGLTLRQFIAGTGSYGGYAPAGHGGNNPDIYASNVAGWLGINPDVPLRDAFAQSGPGPAPSPWPISGGTRTTTPTPTSTWGGALLDLPTFADAESGGISPVVLIAGAALLLFATMPHRDRG